MTGSDLKAVRDRVLSTAPGYFPVESIPLFVDLPIPASRVTSSVTASLVKLPEWAQDLGVGTTPGLLVPDYCIDNPADPDWRKVDWWLAAFQLVTCQAEYRIETDRDVVHSYSSRLPESMSTCWDRAWVNRIYLFLRRWVVHSHGVAESELFGARRPGVIYLTHDVDYVSKSLALRFKQCAFVSFNICRSLLKGNFTVMGELFSRLMRFGLGGGNYWQFPSIQALEAEYGVTSFWNFYGGAGGFARSASELLLDPCYRVADQKICAQLMELQETGHRVGLHQGFHSWQDSERMMSEKARVEASLGCRINSCRQHWLRFSFEKTWKAQEMAGFELDGTLGFNDRAGFRNSAALRMPAWINSDCRFSDSLTTVPMVLMDSHLFDYGQLEADARKQVIDYYLDEIDFVGGEASVIWHHRVFHSDYGWGDDYKYLLDGIKARKLETSVG